MVAGGVEAVAVIADIEAMKPCRAFCGRILAIADIAGIADIASITAISAILRAFPPRNRHYSNTRSSNVSWRKRSFATARMSSAETLSISAHSALTSFSQP